MAGFGLFKKIAIVDKKDFESMKKSLDELEKIKNFLRPQDENTFFAHNRTQSWNLFDTRVNEADLLQMSVYADVLVNIFNTLRNEMFRNGFESNSIQPYENDLQKEKIERISACANLNKQTLTEVFKEFENDLNILDNGYMLARMSYFVNPYNEIIGGEVEEVLRVDPMSIEMIFDSSNRPGYDKEGKAVYFDPEDRTQLTHEPLNADGRKNLKACYRIRATGTAQGQKAGYTYYDNNEIIHVAKYNPSKTYGFSPLYSLYNKVITLVNMDYYMKQYYSGDKQPKGLLTVNTSNAKGFLGWWDEFVEKIRRNPHSINPLVHQSADGKDVIKWVDFMRNMQEMQYTEVRNEIMVKIGAVYNVSPVFQNDVSTGGGLNNEGLQIKVTDRGVEMGQTIYNDKVLPWLCRQLGITDYEWKLLPSREQDQMAEKELRLKEIAIAKATAELGIEVAMNETGEFSYKPGKVELQDSADPQAAFFKSNTPAKPRIESTLAKQDVVPKKQQREIESALTNELKKLLKKFDTKTRPSQKELEAKIKETVKDFDKAIKTKSSRKLKAIYQKAMKDLGKELDTKFTLNEQDKNVIDALKKSPVYQEAFEGISKDISTKLTAAVSAAYQDPDGFTIDKVVERMKEETDSVESKLRTIARTETTKISVASRKVQYDKTGDEYKYFHIGPNDNRTSKQSKEMKQLTKNGVSWEEYVKIMKGRKLTIQSEMDR